MAPDHLRELEQLARHLAGRNDLGQHAITSLAATWRARVSPASKDEEPLDLCDASGTPTGVTAPRWLCHLVGLCHRATHILLRSPQDLLVLQVRSASKADWPGHLDTSVGGHVRAGLSFLEAGVEEMEQELGLTASQQAAWLVEGRLTKVGEPYLRVDHVPGDPPVRNTQVSQIFAGTLTPSGMANIRFRDGEVSALYLCATAEAERLVAAGAWIAPGLAHSLPRYLAWYRGGAPADRS